MSLSFVSKSVQTSTSDGGFEEKPIEGSQNDESSSSAQAKPLFEQLRANKEQEEAEREEFQRSIMRGTLALDEADAAHLDSLQKQRMQQESIVQQQTEAEIAAFRAARADRLEQQVETKGDFEKTNEALKKPVTAKPAPPTKAMPKIVIKKRRRKQDGEDQSGSDTAKKAKAQDFNDDEKEAKLQSESKLKAANGALGGLLCGYGSSDDEDSD